MGTNVEAPQADMGRLWTLLCAVVTLAIPSRAWAQPSTAAMPSFPDSLSCLVQPAALGVARDSLARDARDTTSAPQRAGRAASGAPAIVLRASASAREVRFASQPRIQVRLCGGVLDSVRVLERRNLPGPVQPGVTYRDVFVAVEILGHLNAECLASTITGRGTVRNGACASLQLRDTTGARRTPP